MCLCGTNFPPGFVTTTSAHIAWYGDAGWKNIPCFLSSPQFFKRAISKSSLLLAVSCCCCAIWVSAAFLQSACNFPSNGQDSVADKPTLKLWFALISVRTGFIQLTSPGLSGIPSGPSTSISICISDPSGNQRTTSPSSLPSLPSEI